MTEHARGLGADLAARLAHVEVRLAYEIDVVAAEREVTSDAAVLIDTRRLESWEHGHIAGALHLSTSRVDELIGELSSTTIDELVGDLPRDRTLIVYGWGPGCNGATATARTLLTAGFDVRELLGGYEYWVRNGFPTEVDGVATRTAPDPLVTAEH